MTDAMLERAGVTRQWGTGLATLMAVGLAMLPMLLHPYLPMVDLPNHMARHYIAANPGTALDAYYSYSFAAKGNSAGDILWLLIGRHVTDVYTFSRILFAIYAANLVLSTAVLGRVFLGRWTLWPLASLLLVFNAPFFWGFQNFLVTVPLAIYALAGWLAAERMRPWVRALIFAPVSFALFQLHILGCVVFLAAAGGREIQRLIAAGRGWPRYLWRNLSTLVPFLVPVGMVLLTFLLVPPNIYGNITRYGALADRLAMLISPVDAVTNDGSSLLSLSGALTLGALLLAVATLRRRKGPRLILEERAIGPVLGLLVLCLAVPSVLDGVAMVQIRFPFVLMAVLLAGTQWTGVRPGQISAILLVFALLATGRAVLTERLAARYSADMGDLSAVFDQTPAGARLLPVRMTPRDIMRSDWHLQAHAVMQANAFVPTLFRGSHALKVKPEWIDITVPQGMSIPARFILGGNPVASADVGGFWPDWQTRFTHILALDPVPAELLASQTLTQVSAQGRFALYRIGQ